MVKRNYDVRVLEAGISIMPPSFEDGVDYGGGAGVPDPFNDNDLVQRWPLGTAILEGGIRKWVYAKAGATALAPGKLVQSVVPTAGHENMATSAALTGATAISVTPVTTDIAVDEYNGGMFYVNDMDGEGQWRRIQDVPAIVAAAAGVITLLDPIKTALTANSQTTLMRNPFREVIIHPSPPTAALAGVPATPIGAARYGWLCVRGPAAVLTEGTVAINTVVVSSLTVNGAVAPWVLIEGTPPTGQNYQVVGTCVQLITATEYTVVNLNLPF